ncbi:MAG: hypothetical protein EP319_01160 [Deltaproteobacteria bacterium]|nr:MAG: hypothetical protein EP319_01160 [Deltaproteobacteria bacterium]
MSAQILNGNELIIQGGLEAGFSLYTGYPGSPLADYFNILYQKKQEMAQKGIKVVIANSEANAAAMASGAKQAGRDVMVAMKSMGLHVASDALSVGNFANPGTPTIDPETGEEVWPGVVIVVGDDPWSMSTSTPADSRYLYKHLHIPFLEPSTPTELKDWIKISLQISKRTSVYQGLLLTTFMAEGGGRVELGEEAKVDPSKVHVNTSEFDLSRNVMVPPNSLLADVSMIKKRFPKVKQVLKELALDTIVGNRESKIGIISSGVIYETVKQVLDEGDYLPHVDLYKVACSYPLVDEFLVPWLKSKENVIVIEEKRGFLENELKELCQENKLTPNIFGKKFDNSEGFPAHGGLNFEIVRDKLSYLIKQLGLHQCSQLQYASSSWENPLPRRLPTFCPGCPHRETLSLLKDLRRRLSEENIDLVSHGDVGCYSLSFLPPFKEMHNLSAMGQGGALGAGMDMFTDNPSVVLMGDSTFFHSGMTDISNSVQSGHNITYILLDNDNTAMTGHQMTPRSGESVDGHVRPRQDMLRTARALGVQQAIEVNPSDRYFYQNLLFEYVKKPGVKVIVSNKECGLTFHGRKKAQERKLFSEGKTQESRSFYQINTQACEDCRECVELTGCPGLTQTFDAYGSKVMIDPQICVSDSYCTKIKACPSFEMVEVLDYHPTKYQKESDSLDSSTSLSGPSQKKTLESIANGDDWHCVVTGVGGSGVTTISRVLAEAAREMDGRDDLDFKFMDQKGLAQRNGNVTGHLCLFKKGKSKGAVTPLGKADLMVSPDLLDGSQHIGFLSHDGLLLLDEKFQMPLSIILDRGVEKEPLSEKEMRSMIQDKMGEHVSLYPMKDICDRVFGKSVYASAMILGVAFQSGRIPFSLSNMLDAFRNTMKKSELENNLTAFHLGRRLYLEGTDSVLATLAPKEKEPTTISLFGLSLKQSLLPWHNKNIIIKSFNHHLERLNKYFPDIRRDYLAQYLHDIFIYDRGAKAQDFVTNAGHVSELYKDKEEQRIALRTLAKTYWVKDEVFVSHLMLSPLQAWRDRKFYGRLGTSFRKTHINRPAFDVFGTTIEFDINPKDWMLGIMRHFRILRLILPSWHKKEKKINIEIRNEILGPLTKIPDGERRKRLKNLENIKGYRDVRYKSAQGIVSFDDEKNLGGKPQEQI